jgi:hypothetical protein
VNQPTLLDLLGGRRSALDATAPTAVFVVVLITTGGTRSDAGLRWSLIAGVLTALAVGIVRLWRGQQPRAAIVGLLPVIGGAAIAAWTGRAEDFFLLRVLANAGSALAWTVSIWIRWPLLGVVTGTLLRQGGRWRADPDLFTGYRRGSWWWAVSFWFRAAVFAGLWLAEQPILLGVAQVILSWPLMTLVLLVSWRELRHALPPGHPGLVHPRTTADATSAPPTEDSMPPSEGRGSPTNAESP